jgi:hypothetical protein
MRTTPPPKKCLIKGCKRTVVYLKHGLCRAHTLRFYRNGDPGTTPINKKRVFAPYQPKEVN